MLGPFTPAQARSRLDTLLWMARVAGGVHALPKADQDFVVNEFSRLAPAAAVSA